jgi:hypothetical protein
MRIRKPEEMDERESRDERAPENKPRASFDMDDLLHETQRSPEREWQFAGGDRTEHAGGEARAHAIADKNSTDNGGKDMGAVSVDGGERVNVVDMLTGNIPFGDAIRSEYETGANTTGIPAFHAVTYADLNEENPVLYGDNEKHDHSVGSPANHEYEPHTCHARADVHVSEGDPGTENYWLDIIESNPGLVYNQAEIIRLIAGKGSRERRMHDIARAYMLLDRYRRLVEDGKAV